MGSGLGNKLTGQIGEYLVCAELGRRGFIATPFSGNVPTFDVLATDEHCRTVPIQVKASRGDSWPSDARLWMEIELDAETKVQKCLRRVQIQHPDLIYVCVAIAAPGGRDRFFILTKADLQSICVDEYSSFLKKHNGRRPRNPASYDNRYFISSLQRFENNWELISLRLQSSSPDQSLVENEG
jgi:hypothetical protein